MIDECKSITWYRNDISSPSGRADNYNSSCSQTLSSGCAVSLYTNSAGERNHIYGFYASCEWQGSLCRFPGDSRSSQLHSSSLKYSVNMKLSGRNMYVHYVRIRSSYNGIESEFHIFHSMWVVRRPNTCFMFLWHELRVRISWLLHTLHLSCIA